MSQTIILPRCPDDFHLHLRDGLELETTLKAAISQHIRRGLVMPNILPPVTNVQLVIEYHQRILATLQKLNASTLFTPLMTLYLTDQTTIQDIVEARDSGVIVACKLYPKGVTTHSHTGVTSISALYPIFQVMSDHQLLLLIHGEVASDQIDIFDRERLFLGTELAPLITNFPHLKIVLEHVTTTEAVDFVISAPSNLQATITPHHLLYNRNALFYKGLNPHLYCLPILKTESDRQSLLGAVRHPKFFAGSDSAPHAQNRKECEHGCAGVFNGFASVELYTEVFDSINALEVLSDFLTTRGAEFYGLPLNPTCPVILNKISHSVPEMFPFGEHVVIPLRAGDIIQWKMT